MSFDPYYKWLGIPAEEQPPNHYRLLGLQLFEHEKDVIAHAADRQMAFVRTFVTGPYGSQAEELLSRIAEARVCLLNPKRRSAYDQQLPGGEATVEPPTVPLAQPTAAPPNPATVAPQNPAPIFNPARMVEAPESSDPANPPPLPPTSPTGAPTQPETAAVPTPTAVPTATEASGTVEPAQPQDGSQASAHAESQQDGTSPLAPSGLAAAYATATVSAPDDTGPNDTGANDTGANDTGANDAGPNNTGPIVAGSEPIPVGDHGHEPRDGSAIVAGPGSSSRRQETNPLTLIVQIVGGGIGGITIGILGLWFAAGMDPFGIFKPRQFASNPSSNTSSSSTAKATNNGKSQPAKFQSPKPRPNTGRSSSPTNAGKPSKQAVSGVPTGPRNVAHGNTANSNTGNNNTAHSNAGVTTPENSVPPGIKPGGTEPSVSKPDNSSSPTAPAGSASSDSTTNSETTNRQPASPDVASTNRNSSPTPATAPPVRPGPARPSREPIPKDEDLVPVRAIVRALFETKYKAADRQKRADELRAKTRLADEMYRAQRSERDTVKRYALLESAFGIAIEGGDPDVTFRILDRMTELYEVDANSLRAGHSRNGLACCQNTIPARHSKTSELRLPIR